MDFASYCVFLFLGAIFGAFFGLMAMRRLWASGQTAESRGWWQLGLLALIVAAYSARGRW